MALWKSLVSFFVFVNWYTIKYLLTGTEGKVICLVGPKVQMFLEAKPREILAIE